MLNMRLNMLDYILQFIFYFKGFYYLQTFTFLLFQVLSKKSKDILRFDKIHSAVLSHLVLGFILI